MLELIKSLKFENRIQIQIIDKSIQIGLSEKLQKFQQQYTEDIFWNETRCKEKVFIQVS
jgi:hypothetical protein